MLDLLRLRIFCARKLIFRFYFCTSCSCNTTAKPLTTIKVLLIGGDWLQGAVLRHYVDLLGVRPPDWVHHLRFYIVPLCKTISTSINQFIANLCKF